MKKRRVWAGVGHGSHLERIVDDDFELTESTIVEHARRYHLRAVFHVAMSVRFGDGLPVL